MSEVNPNGCKSKKVGILGGTFDPVHLAHLNCAKKALDTLGLDEVVFVPAGRPSFKLDKHLADVEKRIEMCELAVSEHPKYKVSDIEAKREGVSYTIDTINDLLANEYNQAKLFFIIGSDAFLTLPKWRSAYELARLVDFAVFMRSDDDETRVTQTARDMNARIHLIDSDRIDISSTQIRRMIQKDEPVGKYLPDGVDEYIKEEGLYHDEKA